VWYDKTTMSREPDENSIISFIATTVETMRDRMETMRDGMVTRTDLAELATKNDVARLETIMSGDFEQVHIRLDSIDRAIANRISLIETELSRLRSVVYLLAKDKPDMLRLLGRADSGEDSPF